MVSAVNLPAQTLISARPSNHCKLGWVNIWERAPAVWMTRWCTHISTRWDILSKHNLFERYPKHNHGPRHEMAPQGSKKQYGWGQNKPPWTAMGAPDTTYHTHGTGSSTIFHAVWHCAEVIKLECQISHSLIKDRRLLSKRWVCSSI